MSQNTIIVEDLLSPPELAKLDGLCRQLSGARCLPELADFLSREFSLDVVLDRDITGGYVEDSSNLAGEADALCRPECERDCAIAVRACYMAGIPFTVSAGRSNLTGSATPRGGLILSTAAMLAPGPSVDAGNMTVHAPVGVVLEDLRSHVRAETSGKLCFPVDPTSRSDAAVGGAVACNASGFTPGEAGAMRHWVDAIEFLFPDGCRCSAKRGQYISSEGHFTLRHGDNEWDLPVPRYVRPAVKNAAGPYSAPDGHMDFVDLVVGSEGILGIVAACTLRLAESPSDHLDLFFSLPGEDRALALLSQVQSTCLNRLSAFEYFGINCRQYMDHGSALFHGDDPVAVYLQQPFSGTDAENAMEDWLGVLSRPEFGINEDAIMLLDSERTRSVFMEARHSMPANSLEVVQHRGTYTIMSDTVVPADRFAEFLSFTHGRLQAEGMDYLSFGHLGDCHLHFMILPSREQLDRGREIYDEIVAKSAELGGVYSGEHGTGKRKRRDFARCYGSEGVEQVRECKYAVDPRFLLNRGNVVEPPA